MLFWAVVLSLFSSLAQWLTSARYRALMPYVAATTLSVVTFFVTVMVFAANPFERLPSRLRTVGDSIRNCRTSAW
jgi:cytochrome c-type biogenesis protein CcmF